jgi:hypothetical protein
MSFGRMLDPGDWLATKPQLDPAALTLGFRYRPESGEIKLRFSVGGFVLAAALAAGYFFGDDGVALLVICGFAFFAWLNIVYGILQVRFSMAWSISSGEVMMEKTTLLGRRSWREPVSAYRGVVLREEELTGRGVDNTSDIDRYHIVELQHADPARTLPLYVRADGPSPRDVQQAFSDRFRLPAIDSDLSLLQSSAAPAPDPGPPPAGIKLHQVGAVTVLSLERGRLGRILPKLLWLLFPALAGYLVYQIDPQFVLYAAGMAGGLVLVILLFGWLTERGRPPRGICIDARCLWIGSPKEPPRLTVPFEAIERIRVDQGLSGASRGPSRRLTIEAGTTRIEYATAPFGRKQLEWARLYLLYRLGR